jgi:hypothetical protein
MGKIEFPKNIPTPTVGYSGFAVFIGKEIKAFGTLMEVITQNLAQGSPPEKKPLRILGKPKPPGLFQLLLGENIGFSRFSGVRSQNHIYGPYMHRQNGAIFILH